MLMLLSKKIWKECVVSIGFMPIKHSHLAPISLWVRSYDYRRVCWTKLCTLYWRKCHQFWFMPDEVALFNSILDCTTFCNSVRKLGRKVSPVLVYAWRSHLAAGTDVGWRSSGGASPAGAWRRGKFTTLCTCIWICALVFMYFYLCIYICLFVFVYLYLCILYLGVWIRWNIERRWVYNSCSL